MAYVITTKGLEIIGGRVVGGAQAEPKILSWGLNPSGLTSNVTDVALFQESSEARVTGVSSLATTTTTHDTYKVIGTINATGTHTIREAALFDASIQPAQSAVGAGSTVIGSPSGTQITVPSTFNPGNGNYIQIRGEVMQVTSGSGTTSLTVTRAQAGTTAISTIAANDPITIGNPTGTSTVAGASMFAKADFAAVGVSPGDAIQFTWTIVWQ